jgi:proteic killer suppression protein
VLGIWQTSRGTDPKLYAATYDAEHGNNLPAFGVLIGVTDKVTLPVIRSFRHKGLERFFLSGTKSGIRPEQADRLRLILAQLHAAVAPGDIALPGLRLHELKGDRKGTWSVAVSGNWRITFSFDGKDAIDVDYEDYH